MPLLIICVSYFVLAWNSCERFEFQFSCYSSLLYCLRAILMFGVIWKRAFVNVRMKSLWDWTVLSVWNRIPVWHISKCHNQTLTYVKQDLLSKHLFLLILDRTFFAEFNLLVTVVESPKRIPKLVCLCFSSFIFDKYYYLYRPRGIRLYSQSKCYLIPPLNNKLTKA